MPPDRPGLFGVLFGVLCVAMFGLAAGAVWMLPSMMFGRALPALVLPVGWILGVVTRRWLRFDGPVGALLAAAGTVLASAYTACLVAGATISWLMGIGFGRAVTDAGPGMLISLARLAQGPSDYALYALGALIAALAAWPVARHRASEGFQKP